MKKVGDYIVYQKDVCKIVGVGENKFSHFVSYSIIPLRDSSLILNIPVNNKNIRDLMTKEEIDHFINDIPNIPLIEQSNRQIENDYKYLLASGTPSDLIKIIKTTYLRNQERLSLNKKISDKDHRYFEMAEQYLYNEIAVALNLSYDDAKEYIISKVKQD